MDLGSGIRDPGSRKNLIRIPDPGVKKAPDPGSGSATLVGNIQIDLTKEEATSPPERPTALQNTKYLLFLFISHSFFCGSGSV